MSRPLARFLKVEQLEDRAVPAVFNGTAGNDRFVLSPIGTANVLISRYGDTSTLLGQAVVSDDSNQINGLDGNDSVSVTGVLPLAFTFDGGNGNDVIYQFDTPNATIHDLGDTGYVTIGSVTNFRFNESNVEQALFYGTPGDNEFNVLLGPGTTSLVFNGGDGKDTVKIYNSTNVSVGDAGSVVKVDRPGFGSIYVNDGDVESVFLGGTAGNDTFNVGPLPDYTSITLFGGVGTDVANVFGLHAATVTDSGDYGIIQEVGKAPILFADAEIETLTLYGTSAGDSITVGAPTSTLIAINGLGGTDLVAFTGLTSSNLYDYGTYSVVGNAGAAPVFVSDTDVESIYLYGTAGDDAFDIANLTNYASVAILGGAGNDTVYAEGLNGSQLDSFPGYGVLTRTSVGTGALFFSDTDVESLYLIGTSASDTFNVFSRPSYTTLGVLGLGGNNDVLNLYNINGATVTDYGVYGTLVSPGGATVFVSDTDLEFANMRGTSGDDVFNISTYLTYCKVTAYGEAGNDTLIGGGGDDYLDGGPGNDILIGNGGNDTLVGGDGDDQFSGGAGNDTVVDLIPTTALLTDTSFTSGSVVSNPHGVENWTFTGGDLGVIIDCLAWTQTNLSITGGAGNDILKGGSLNDTIDGKGGNDQLAGSSGNDSLIGGDGDDQFIGGSGFDTATDLIPTTATLTNADFNSGAVFSFNHGVEAWTFTSSDSGVTIDASAWTLNGLSITGGAGNDILKGGSQNDLLDGKGGNDQLYGGAGNDTALDLIPSNAVLSNANFTSGGITSLNHGIENWTFTSGDFGVTIDASLWTGLGLIITGGNGNDVLKGGSGNDVITGGNGNDSMSGGDGDDKFLGGIGNDSVTDLIPATATLNNATFVSGAIVSSGHAVENWTFTSRNTGVRIDASTWTGNGLSITGGSGNDYLAGGSGNDTITGGSGNDTLYGYAGDDTLDGGDGNDGLFGGIGTNLLTGGNDKDRFDVLIRGGVLTTILDLNPEDARINFRDTAAATDLTFVGYTETFNFAAASWTEAEIVSADAALANIHQAVNNTVLLKKSDGAELTFFRYGVQNTFTAVTVWNGINQNNGNLGLMSVTASAGATAIYKTIAREMGHNWDEPAENTVNLTAFRAISNWIQSATDPGSNYTASSGVGDDWWYFNTAQFARALGRLNPFEDYATTWETYFAETYLGAGASGNLVVSAKLNNIAAFIAAKYTP